MNTDTLEKADQVPYKLIPLNPDVKIDSLEDDSETHTQLNHVDNLRKSTQKLEEFGLKTFISDLNYLEEDVFSPHHLVQLMNERGINEIFLGKIASECKYNHVKEMAVIEIIATSMDKVISDGLNLMWEDTEIENIEVSDDQIHKYLLNFFNDTLTLDE